MTNDEMVSALRAQGFAVCIFDPVELQGADPDKVEDRLVELGWEVIDVLQYEGEYKDEDEDND